MKVQFQKILMNEELSFIAKELELPRFDSEFHFHPEYELKYVIRSKGKRFVGDRIDNFQEGDLVLLGPNIPHYWKNDREYYENDNLTASAFLVMFSEDFLGEQFFLLPEMASVKDILNMAKGGVFFPDANKHDIPLKLKQLIESKGPLRIMTMINILAGLAKAEARPLLTETFVAELPLFNYSDPSFRRLKNVHEYVIANFQKKIQIRNVAEIANMTTHSFCKYFRKSTKKTFVTFLTELRVCHAKKLLIENDQTISEICYASGFDNLSNFNRRFKMITSMTPKEFRNQYIN
ncbi:MAG: AraC family transcriptional regulator [Bacteroidales bacterium]|nr:AraC family transcriptional regulator [Bacteroidales bacterium]